MLYHAFGNLLSSNKNLVCSLIFHSLKHKMSCQTKNALVHQPFLVGDESVSITYSRGATPLKRPNKKRAVNARLKSQLHSRGSLVTKKPLPVNGGISGKSYLV
jgi:hypothetical protein